MDVLCFGKLISFISCLKRALSSRNSAFVITSLRFVSLTLRQTQNADSRRVVVGNIHAIYNPRKGEVKLGQIRLLLLKAQTLSEKWGNIPIIIAGDFNCTPQSPVYQFMSSSKLDVKFYDKGDLSGQRTCRRGQSGRVKEQLKKPYLLIDRLLDYGWTDEEFRTATGNSSGTIVYHPLKLRSSYASVKGSECTRDSCGEPLATTFHAKILGTVDYLWYTDGLVPTRVLDTLPLDVLTKTHGLPYENLGSDHLALATEFAFTQQMYASENLTG
ncbi:hypothetical protein Sjap_024369 [Stephania japonica]|uniref:Endonuclease/exonuclease/phosphatase domain-containing protein n=1 Tax=Stephania japonica TaxID=461633 RepID=A0AAP0EGH9_9MAGN